MKQVHFPETERVRELFDYHPDGYLVWKRRPGKFGNAAKVGERAGYANGPYRRLNFDKRPYYEHVVVWAWHNNSSDRKENTCIDHINGERSDNRIENLREISMSQNSANSVFPARNRTGFRGVYKRYGQYGADIRHQKKLIHLGFYATPEEAHEAYNAKYVELYGELPDGAACQMVDTELAKTG